MLKVPNTLLLNISFPLYDDLSHSFEYFLLFLVGSEKQKKFSHRRELKVLSVVRTKYRKESGFCLFFLLSIFRNHN